MKHITVRMSDFKVTKAPFSIKTNSLGSCVAVVLYDKQKKIGGMAHIMLANSPPDSNEVGKYADKAIPKIIDSMINEGCQLSNISAMLFGGAEMFFFSDRPSIMKIGTKNTELCKVILKDYNIPIIAEETGGKIGRTIELDCNSGLLVLFDFTLNKKVFSFV